MARRSVLFTLVVLAAALLPTSAAHIPTSAGSPLSTLSDPYACSGPTPVGLSVCTGGPSLSWYRTTVDVGTVGQYTSIAIDAAGNPAIAYYAQQTADVKLATLGDAGAWSLQTVDSAGSVGKGTSLAFTPQGAPVITYYDNTNGALKAAERSNGTWTFSVVAPATTLAGVTSLAIQPDGTRIVAWTTTSGALMVGSSTGGSWSVVVLSSKANGHISLALDASGEPAIAFGRNPIVASQNELWYVSRDGGAWNAPVKIESGGRFGYYASLRFTSAGLPIIAYSDLSSASMSGWTAKLAEFDGTQWTNRSLAVHGVDSGYFLALTLDANDCPSVTYWRHTTGGLVNTRSDCATWITQTIDRGGSAYWYTSAVSDAMGRPMIATWENSVGNTNGLRFATLGIDTCYPVHISPIWFSSPPASCDVHVHERGGVGSSFDDEGVDPSALPSVRIPHAPILVQGDLGFLLPTSGVKDPLALGTPDDPFVIEGWQIAGAPGGLRTGPGGHGAAIQIRDTTRHVIIRDSTIETLDDLRSVGIWLVNASNVTIQGLTFQSNLGMWVAVTNPSLGIVWDGAQVLVEAASHDVLVEGNEFLGGSVGVIAANGSRDVRVIGNSFVAPRGAAVYATSVGANFEIASNVVSDGVRAGFAVAYGSSSAWIHDNDVTTTYIPLSLYASTSVVVERNRFTDSWYGGLLDSATGNVIRNNAIDHPYYDGLQIRASSANTLENNTIRDAGNQGIWIMGSSANNTLSHNSISTSGGPALRVGSSSGTRIVSNAFWRNGGAVHLESAPSTTIQWNNFNANGVGVNAGSAGNVDATMNWWGHASGPGMNGADRLVGTASASPWLTSANPDAGAHPAAAAP